MRNNIWSRLAGRDKQKLNKRKTSRQAGSRILTTSRGKPFFVLAPMAGVTDSPFRQMIGHELSRIKNEFSESDSAPDLMFTEFVSTEMIWRNFFDAPRSDLRDYPEVRPQKIPPILRFDKKEKPLIVQFFGCKEEQFAVCAKLALELGFDGIDINVGCPDRKVQKQGSGSELIKNPELVIEIIKTVKSIVGGKIPVSVKTRIGYSKKDHAHILAIAKEGVDAISIHGRTASQGYSGEADWVAIGKIAGEIKKINPNIVVVGNGDVKSIEQGKKLAEKYGVDGVMIGREVLKNPWVFSEEQTSPSVKKRLGLALEHTRLFEKHYQPRIIPNGSNVGAMKKYYKAYFTGVRGDLFPKRELMEARTLEEAKEALMSKSKLPISNKIQSSNIND